jgi:formate-dependent phosphoribosylglycinamide formyltransferase (GAR transformylase)
MRVILLGPHFPIYQRQFVRALREIGVEVAGIGDWDFYQLDDQLRRWLYWYERVPDMKDEEAIAAAAKKIHSMGAVDRLEATIEAQMIPAAKARMELGIAGQTLEEVELCRDKYRMKQHLRKQGIPCARAEKVSSAADARRIAKEVGFPIILKPLDAAGAYDTHRCGSEEELENALRTMDLDGKKRTVLLEEFIEGHEGFWDTLTVNGEVKFKVISHYYPNVLPAMRDRSISPKIITTNRQDLDGYRDLNEMGHAVIKALGIRTAPTHMEWFIGPKGLYFGEIGSRPAGVRFWEIYCWANDMDLFRDWATAICYGYADPKPSRRYAMGLVAVRPNKDGHYVGYSGVEEIRRTLGEHLIELVLPRIGEKTQPVEYGYNAHAYAWVRHPDYDECRRLLDWTGNTLKAWAE